MNLIKPEKLKTGDTIAFIAPSGVIGEEKVLNAKKYFEDKGYKIKLGKNIFKQHRYMAGSDDERLQDLEQAFEDDEVRAIMCVRGGYGALRLVDKINYKLIQNNPKIFCGYSDITVLSAMIYKKTGLITYSSPMPKGDFQPEDLEEYTQKHFWEALTCDNLTIRPLQPKTYKEGNANGILWGGNLSSLASMCGIDFLPEDKFIFFTEDLNEPVYKIDKYFRQLMNTEQFRKNVSAIILGDFLDVEYPQQLEELFTEIAQELNVPTYGGYPISHSKIKATIPIGQNSILNNGLIIINN